MFSIEPQSPRHGALRAGVPLTPPRRFAIHGLALEIRCDVPLIGPELEHLLHPFSVQSWPEGFTPITGSIQPFDLTTVQKHLSPSAIPFAPTRELIELYQDGERFWLVDDRWGMAEINILKGQWRSWVLPRPGADALRCAEMAVLWPLAQLLRAKGLHLLPAASIFRGGWGALLISPFGLEPELTALARNGYRIVGQRWTALREEDGRIAMLRFPGSVERVAAPRLRNAETLPPGSDAIGASRSPHSSTSASPAGRIATRVDLNYEFIGSEQNHAFCDAVLIAEPGRRPSGHLRELGHSAALNILRRSWPIVDLMPHRRSHQLPPRLANHCRCAELQLSRNPNDLLRLLDTFHQGPRPIAGKKPTSPLELSLYLKAPLSSPSLSSAVNPRRLAM